MLEAGTTAPDFALRGLDGQEHRLSEALARGPVLLVFFKVSCSTSQFTAPFVERLFQDVAPHGGQIWGVSQDTAVESRRFVGRFELSFPILIDEPPYQVSRQYKFKFVPSLFLIAADGRIHLSFDGFSKPDMLAAQSFFAAHFSFTPLPFFDQGARIPQYKPG